MIPTTEQQRLEHNLIQRVNLADSLRRNAALYGRRIALVDPREQVTYAELHRDANRVAEGLLAAGVTRGDFVGLLFRNCVDFYRVYFACARVGAIALPLNPTLRIGEFSHIIGEARPKVLVAQGDYQEVAEELAATHESLGLLALAARSDDASLAPLSSDRGFSSMSFADLHQGSGDDVEVIVEDRDALQCIYTSGTTANPKGVITSHLAAVFTALSAAHHMRIDDGDTGLIVLPIHHVGGLNDTSIPHLVVGATVILVDGWGAAKVASALQEHGITNTLLTAPMWIELIGLNRDGRYDWSSMRTCLFAIASLPPERSAELREMCPGAAVLLCSGQTEFTGYEEGQRREHQFTKPFAWGDPTLMTDVGIMNDEGQLLGPDEIGEIVYRGPQAMTEYFAHPDLTAEAFAHGWFHSGDLGYLDEDHTVFFVDRKKDMIKTGGENVASVEVAHVLLAHPAVADCAVVGLPHERWTEAITAFIQVAPEATVTEEELLAHCRERLAGYKVPKRLLLVDDFPRTASGKIQKVKLREEFRGLYETATARDSVSSEGATT